MTIRKITGLEGGFSIVPNATLNDALSWEAIGLLAYLCAKPDDWEVCIAQLINQSKKSAHPSGRDKTYRILTELQEAGYVRKVNSRENGKFTGVEYIVSPTKFEDFTDNAPFTDLPDTDLPDTANPPQQKKESNKERNKQIGEKVSPSLFDKEEKKKKPRKRHHYPSDFEAFFQLYPKTKGSKLEALKAWKRLTKDEKARLYRSIKHYKAALAEETWRKAMIPARYIREEHFLVYYAPEGVLEPADAVYVNGKSFAPGALIELCTAYFKSSEWKYDRLLGPAPDNDDTQIPANLVDEAQKLVYGSAKN